MAVLWEHGDWGSNAAKLAAQVATVYVNKKRMQEHNARPQTVNSTPVEMGAVWSEPGPSRPGPSGRNRTAQASVMHSGTFQLQSSSSGASQSYGQQPVPLARLDVQFASRCAVWLQEGTALMRRFLSFRDFDWALLGMVLLLCTLSVLEIYTATLHTRYTGFHTKQMFWITGGLVSMFIFCQNRLSQAAGFGSLGLRLRHCGAVGGHGGRTQGSRRKTLDQDRPHALPALRVDQAGADSGCGPLLCQSGRTRASHGRIFSRLLRWWAFPCCWSSSSPTWEPHLPTRRF